MRCQFDTYLYLLSFTDATGRSVIDTYLPLNQNHYYYYFYFSGDINREMADNVDVEEYAKNIDRIVHSGFTCLAVGLGINTGLIDIISKLNKPESISLIAELSNLNERYDFINHL